MRKRKYGLWILLLFVLCINLDGCKSVELEERAFPMLVGVEASELGTISYNYVFANEWSDLNSYVDYNHLKVVLLEKNFLQREGLYDSLLDTIVKDDTFPRNTYVAVTDNNAVVIENLEEKKQDAGTYIENMLKATEKEYHKHLPTIGDLIDEKENRMRIWQLPVLGVEEGQLKLESYYSIEYGNP